MKKLTAFLLAIGLFCCEKKSVNITTRPYTDTFSSATLVAERFFEDSILNKGTGVGYRASTPRTPIWNEGETGTYEGMAAVYVPVVYQEPMLMKASFAGSFYFHLNYLTDLVIYKDSLSHFQSRVLTFFPDSTFFKDPTKSFSGIEFVEDWNGNGISKLLYSGGQIRRYVPSTKQVDLMDIIETCYTISGYNYSEDDPDGGYSWSEDGGCSVSYIDAGSGGGVGGSSGSTGGGGEGGGTSGGGSLPLRPANVNYMIPPGNSIIQSIAQYFDCFTSVGGSDHTYTVSVCVNQPDPGTRTPWTWQSGVGQSSAAGTPVNVGHTFLILGESYGGTVITRNIGFYPTTMVWPLSPASPGAFNNDGSHPYNVSGTMQVTNAQFSQILNYIESENIPGITYNLNSFNCTTFAINAMAAAGIYLPNTKGTWADGTGDDPGDLGQDIATGQVPNMAVSTVSPPNHANVGTCN